MRDWIECFVCGIEKEPCEFVVYDVCEFDEDEPLAICEDCYRIGE